MALVNSTPTPLKPRGINVDINNQLNKHIMTWIYPYIGDRTTLEYIGNRFHPASLALPPHCNIHQDIHWFTVHLTN